MKKTSLILSLFIILFGNAYSFAETWEKTFSWAGDHYDYGRSVQQTADGGYIVAGYTEKIGSLYTDVYLLKTDAAGNELWSQTFGGTSYDSGHSVQQTADGGYIIAGGTSSFGAGSGDVYLIKTDAAGNELWSQTFGGKFYDRGHSVQQTADGGYIIAGSTTYDHNQDIITNVYLLKTDASGNELWSQTFGGLTGYSVQQTADGGYIIAGETWSDVYLLKTDAAGNELWSQTFGGAYSDAGYSVQQTADGGFIIAGYTSSYHDEEDDYDVYLLKTDAAGNELWSQTFGGTGYYLGYSVQQTADGGFIIAGYTSESSGTYVYLLKTDAVGNELWSQTFGDPAFYSFGYSVQQTADGGFIIAGHTADRDVYLIYYKPDQSGPTDSDNDGIPDDQDAFPADPNEWEDTDNDGIGNNADTDDDNDGFSDQDEITAGTDPLDYTFKPLTEEDLSLIDQSTLFDGFCDHSEPSLFDLIIECQADANCDKWNKDWVSHDPYGIVPIFAVTSSQAGIVKSNTFITPWADGIWHHEFGTDDDFNVVYKQNRETIQAVDNDGKFIIKNFEVISHVDDNSPLSGSTNINSLLFTYHTKNEVAVTLNEWVNYLKEIVKYYDRPIDTLTIFSHGQPGEVCMSNGFHFKNDSETEEGLKKLKETFTFDGKNYKILSDNSTILLFSCEVGQGEIGQEFIQNFANWTGATVYANTQSTGSKPLDDGTLVGDWNLDVIGIPDDYVFQDEYRTFVQSDVDTTLLLPGGVTIKVKQGALSGDAEIVIQNVTDQLNPMGIDTSGKIIGGAYEISFEGDDQSFILDGEYVEITIPYNPNPSIFNPTANSTVMFWDEELLSWSDTGIWDVLFFEDEYVYFKTNHATIFALLTPDQPPTALCQDVTVTAEPGISTAPASVDAGSFDPDGDPITIEQNPPGPYEIGITAVELIVTDDKGLSSTCTASVTVEQAPAAHCGDANSDGVVNRTDLNFKLKEINNEFKTWKNECYQPKKPCGDFDGNGKINLKDSIAKYAALMKEYYRWYNECWKSN